MIKKPSLQLLAKQGDYPGLKLGQVAVKEKKVEARDIIQSLRAQEKRTRNSVGRRLYQSIDIKSG